MLHFDDRRPHHFSRRSACDEDVVRWNLKTTTTTMTTAKKKKKSVARRSSNLFGSSSMTVTNVPMPHRIDVQLTCKSNLYKSVYWMHPNLAITREYNGEEEFIGEYVFCQATKTKVIVNYFTGLEVTRTAKLRFAHTAHTPPEHKLALKSSEEYLRKNMDTLIKKIDILAVRQDILNSSFSRPELRSQYQYA